jgi:hypothetical protein
MSRMFPLTAIVAVACAGTAAPIAPERLAPPSAAAPLPERTVAPSESAAEAPPPEPPPSPCAGASFDFDELVQKQKCGVSGKPAPPASEVTIHTEPPALQVAPGGHVDFDLVFQNPGTAALDLDLNIGCGRFSLEAYDAAGRRADYVNTTCGFGSGCGTRVIRVTLEPGGTLRKRLGYDASVTKVDEECRDVPAGPMRRGRYRLRIGTPAVNSSRSFDFREVEVEIVVR